MQVPWETLLTQVLLWCLTGLLGWVTGRVTSTAKRDRKEAQALKAGVRALLRSELMRTHHDAMREGSCSTTDKEVMERTYRAYHDLGGNGIATNLYEEMMRLPTHDE